MAGVSEVDFVEDFPEFADPKVYNPKMVKWWLNFAALFINQDRWGVPGLGGNNPRTEFDYGQELYAAHQIVLEKRAMDEAANGAPPGVSTGVISAQSVDKVSVSFDTGSATELGAGHWNLTIYGLRFKRLADAFGAGPVQVSGCNLAPPFSGPAWPGPWVFNAPNMSM